MRRFLAFAQFGLASEVSTETQFRIGLIGLEFESEKISDKTFLSSTLVSHSPSFLINILYVYIIGKKAEMSFSFLSLRKQNYTSKGSDFLARIACVGKRKADVKKKEDGNVIGLKQTLFETETVKPRKSFVLLLLNRYFFFE
jgi:hypothetical protein